MRSVGLRYLAQGMSDEEVAQRTQHPIELVDFVDEAGNRYPGTVRPLNYGNSFMPEYCLLQEPEAGT